MLETLFQVPALVRDVSFKQNRMAFLKVETAENLTDEQVAIISKFSSKEGWFTFSMERIKPDQVLSLPKLPQSKKGLSQSKRMRSAIIVWAAQKGIPKEKQEEVYQAETERIIQSYLSQLEPDDGLEYATNT